MVNEAVFLFIRSAANSHLTFCSLLDIVIQFYSLQTARNSTKTLDYGIRRIQYQCTEWYDVNLPLYFSFAVVSHLAHFLRSTLQFKNAPSFNQDLFWNTARVTDMSQMFEDADAFDGDVSTFNIGNVVNLRMMFRNAISFTGTPDLSSWNFSNVTDATEMFYGARSFQGTGVSFWTIDLLLSPNLMVRKMET